jgi:hypothetical protein
MTTELCVLFSDEHAVDNFDVPFPPKCTLAYNRAASNQNVGSRQRTSQRTVLDPGHAALIGRRSPMVLPMNHLASDDDTCIVAPYVMFPPRRNQYVTVGFG